MSVPALDADRVHYGEWYSLFLDATEVGTDADEKALCNRIRILGKRYYCETCRTHFSAYIGANPPEQYTNPRTKSVEEKRIEALSAGKRLGLFVWLWQAKNNVNRRLGKREIGLEEAYALYSPEAPPCTTCGISDIKSTPAPSPKNLSRMIPIAELLKLRNYQM